MKASISSEFFSTLRAIGKYVDTIKIGGTLTKMELILLHEIYIASQNSNEKYVRISQVIDEMHMTRSAISQGLNSLEKKGCIVREVNKNDRRAIFVSVTEFGVKSIIENRRKVDESLKGLVEDFGEDEFNELLNALKKLNALVEKRRLERGDENC